MFQNPVTLKTVIEFISMSFCHCIFSGSHTNKAEHSSGLWESVSNQSVILNLSTLNHTVRKWNKGSQSEHSGQIAKSDLDVKGKTKRKAS